MAAVYHVQKRCTWHFDLEFCENSVTGLYLTLKDPTPTLHRGEPFKAAPQQPVGESVYFRVWAHISPFFNQRIKFFFASEPNSVSFYWLKWHQAGRGLLGPDSKGKVTNFGDHEGTDHGPFTCTYPLALGPPSSSRGMVEALGGSHEDDWLWSLSTLWRFRTAAAFGQIQSNSAQQSNTQVWYSHSIAPRVIWTVPPWTIILRHCLRSKTETHTSCPLLLAGLLMVLGTWGQG